MLRTIRMGQNSEAMTVARARKSDKASGRGRLTPERGPRAHAEDLPPDDGLVAMGLRMQNPDASGNWPEFSSSFRELPFFVCRGKTRWLSVTWAGKILRSKLAAVARR